MDAGLCSAPCAFCRGTLALTAGPIHQCHQQEHCRMIRRGLNLTRVTPVTWAHWAQVMLKAPHGGAREKSPPQARHRVQFKWIPRLEAFMHTFMLFECSCSGIDVMLPFLSPPDRSAVRQYWFLSGAKSTWSICRWTWDNDSSRSLRWLCVLHVRFTLRSLENRLLEQLELSHPSSAGVWRTLSFAFV